MGMLKKRDHVTITSDILMPQSVTKTCRKCGLQLSSENWRPGDQRQIYHICRSCAQERDKMYYWKNREKKLVCEKRRYGKRREKICECKRNRWRRELISVGKGIILHGRKRNYPNPQKCELCGKEAQTLEYHHYDDDDLMKGLWLCRSCHRFAENVDKGLGARYEDLKKVILT